MITIDHTDGMLCWRPFNYLLLESLLHLEEVTIVYVYTNVYGLRGHCNSSWLLVWIQSLRGINQHWTVAQIEMDGAAQCSGLCKKVGGRIVFNKKTLCLHCWFLTHLTSVQKYTNALVFGIKLAVLYVFLIALTQDPIACFPARISLFCSISHFSLSQFESLQEWVWRPGAPL